MASPLHAVPAGPSCYHLRARCPRRPCRNQVPVLSRAAQDQRLRMRPQQAYTSLLVDLTVPGPQHTKISVLILCARAFCNFRGPKSETKAGSLTSADQQAPIELHLCSDSHLSNMGCRLTRGCRSLTQGCSGCMRRLSTTAAVWRNTRQ